MDRLLKSNGGEIQLFVYDFNGDLQDATGTVTVTITNSAGTTVTSGSATKPTDTTGQYEFTLTPSHTANLDTYTATWSGTVSAQVNTWTTQFEVVGGFYFSVGEARTFDQGVLSGTNDYPTQDIINGREQVEQRIEQITGVSWVPRGKRLTINGLGTDILHLPGLYPRRVVSLAVTDSSGTVDTYDSTELADLVLYDWGQLSRKTLGTFLSGSRNVNILFEYGHDSPPEPLKRAALMMLRHSLVPSNIEDRAISFSDEMGTRQLSVANSDRRRWTGIPDIDSILADYQEKVPVIA